MSEKLVEGKLNIRLEMFMSLNIQVMVFWVVKPCILPEHYMVSQPTKPRLQGLLFQTSKAPVQKFDIKEVIPCYKINNFDQQILCRITEATELNTHVNLREYIIWSSRLRAAPIRTVI